MNGHLEWEIKWISKYCQHVWPEGGGLSLKPVSAQKISRVSEGCHWKGESHELCLATATHNFKWVQIPHICLICKSWCSNTAFIHNNCDF